MKDVRVSRWFFPIFAQIIRWYRCYSLLQTTWLHKSTNINANMWLRQGNLSQNLELPLTYFHRSQSGRCTYIRYMRQLRKCSNVVTAKFLDHDKVQKTDLKPLQLVKSGAPNDNFLKNICSEDDLRSRIFGTFVAKFLACLPLLGFSNI